LTCSAYALTSGSYASLGGHWSKLCTASCADIQLARNARYLRVLSSIVGFKRCLQIIAGLDAADDLADLG